MFVIPSIDLMAGEVVRLAQGKATEKKVYSKDPMAMARRWEKVDGKVLHLVDLEGAFEGGDAESGDDWTDCSLGKDAVPSRGWNPGFDRRGKNTQGRCDEGDLWQRGLRFARDD